MKKFIFIFTIFLPTLLWSQSMNVPTFKIAKPQPKAQDTITPIYHHVTFLLTISAYAGFNKINGLFKSTPSQEIQNRFELDFSVPYLITNNSLHVVMIYAQTGITNYRLTPSNTYAYSIPACAGFLYSIHGAYIYADAGPQFFFKSSDSNFSNNIVFDWGAGIGYKYNGGSLSTLRVGYRRLGNINFEGVGLIFAF
jgi:hypothetical protein